MTAPAGNPAVPPATPPATGPGTPPATPPATPPGGQQGGPAPASPGAGTPPPTPPTPPTPPGDPALGPNGEKALKAERDRAGKAERELAAAKARLDTLERANLSETERAKAESADWQAKYQASESQRLRLQIATQHSIGAEDLILLTGTTEDELTAQAARLVAINAGRAAATAPPTFAPNPAQSAGNGTPPATATVAAGRALYQSKNPKKPS
jgi:hypothetical protein